MSQKYLEYDATLSTGGERQEKLPFDPRTLLRSLSRWRWWLALWLFVCLSCGLAFSWTLAPIQWISESTIIYQPPSSEIFADMYEPPTITTQLNMVKVKSNLSEARTRLAIPVTVEQLDVAAEVTNPKNSELLHFSVKWPDAEMSAAITQTLRDVFISQQQRIRRQEIAAVMQEVQERIDAVQAKILRTGDPNQIAWEVARREKERAVIRTRLETATGNHDMTVTEVHSLESQINTIKAMMDAERARIGGDKNSADHDGPSNININIRLGRLNEMIQKRRQEKVDAKQREGWDRKITWNENALAAGLITKAQYDSDYKAFETWRASVEDDEIITSLKQEREELFRLMSKQNLSTTEMSNGIKQLQLDLRHAEVRLAGLNKKAEEYRRKCVQLEKQLFAIPEYEINAKRLIDPKLILDWRKEVDQLEDALADLRTISKRPNFRIVSDVRVPTKAESYRKLVVLAILTFGTFLGIGAAIGYELLDSTVKSVEETKLRLNQDVLCMLPNVPRDSDGSDAWEHSLLEPIRSVVRQVRSRVPGKGIRLMVVASGFGEGCTTVATQIARCMGQQGENVLLVDGDVRQAKVEESLRDLIVSPDEEIKGLGEFLTGSVTRVKDIIYSTTLFGVRVIPRSKNPIIPELLSSRKMFQMMDDAAANHDVVVIDGPPAAMSADAEILSSFVDGIVVVIQARRFRAVDVKKVLDRLIADGAPVLGVVLNRVDKMFLDSEWK